MGAQQVPEDDLERFLSISTELLCILGFDGEIRRVSGAWTSALGYTAEELVSRRAADFAHPQDRAQLTAAFEKLRDGAGTVTFECRLAGRDGAYRRFYWQARAFPPRQVIYAAARELTDQIRFPEQRYWRLFETSKDGMMVVDAYTAEVLDVNPRVVELFGEPKERMIGRKLADLGFFAGFAFLNELPRKTREEEMVRYQVTLESANGRPIDAELLCNAYKDGMAGHRDVIQINIRDISERRRAENELRESEERFRLLVEGVKDYAIFMLDTEGRVVSWNLGAERILGYREGEILGHDGNVIFTPEDRAAKTPETELQKAASEGKAEDERWHVRKDGTRFFASGVMTGLRDERGRLRGFAKVMRDITERRRTDEALQQAQKLESIGLLAGGVAHDFNNLLTGILGNASLAYDSMAPSDPSRQMLSDVIESSQRAADLTRQLLAYAGKGRLLVERINLSRIVSDILHLIQTSIPKKVNLQLDLSYELPIIEADASQIQQIIMNLAINAAEAIGENGGAVHVSTGVEEVGTGGLPEAVIGEVERGPYVYLEVSDTGAGMDDETRSKIFDPFFTTKFTGRGLGLAAVSGIVRGHKGALLLHSAPGAGSTFRVLLPVARDGVERKPAAAEDVDLRGVGVVLVVDDEAVVLRMAKSALERYGYRVELSADGEQAVRIFRERPGEIAAVLLDMAMPVVSGEDAFQQIKRIRPDVPVIVSSGYSEQVARQRFRASAEVAGFLQKPYTAAQLAEQIKAVIRKQAAARGGPIGNRPAG